jgi:hypothetical protein
MELFDDGKEGRCGSSSCTKAGEKEAVKNLRHGGHLEVEAGTGHGERDV